MTRGPRSYSQRLGALACRLAAARSRGWSLRLTHRDCVALVSDGARDHSEEPPGSVLAEWLGRGLPPAAAKRIERAATLELGSASPGVRLSEREVAAIGPVKEEMR